MSSVKCFLLYFIRLHSWMTSSEKKRINCCNAGRSACISNVMWKHFRQQFKIEANSAFYFVYLFFRCNLRKMKFGWDFLKRENFNKQVQDHKKELGGKKAFPAKNYYWMVTKCWKISLEQLAVTFSSLNLSFIFTVHHTANVIMKRKIMFFFWPTAGQS